MFSAFLLSLCCCLYIEDAIPEIREKEGSEIGTVKLV